MRETLNIGSTPHGEPCACVGEDNYSARARVECNAFREQIRKHYPEPDGGYLAVKGFAHDFGTYYEVCAVFDDNDDDAMQWAFAIEGDELGVLELWDSEFSPAMTA